MSPNPIDSKPVSALSRVFGCDARSLALFRMVVGVILLIDLLMRSQYIEAMYTDSGVLPRDVLAAFTADLADSKDAMSWSLHSASGSVQWQISLFVLAALAAVMFMVGWHTRIATIVSWVLLVSLQARNPLILTSGDTLLKLLLFWSMFLPLGQVWSIDAKRRGQGPPSLHVASAATAGLILVIFSMYFFTGLSKCNHYWLSGEAMDYVLRLDIYATGFGQWMLDYPWLLKIICWLTVGGETLFPLLLFIPWHNDRWRLFNLIFFWGLHASIASVMVIGLFSFTSMIAWLALLPTSFWESRLVARMFPWVQARQIPLGPARPAMPLARGAVQLLAAFFLVYSLCWNLSNTTYPLARDLMPPSVRSVGKWTNLKQGFTMFDVPPQHSPWFVYEAVLKNGKTMDIFRNRPVDHVRPESVRATIPGHHWRRLHRNLVRPAFERFRPSVGNYIVNRWNAQHPPEEQVLFMKWIVYLDEIGPNYNGMDQVVQVWGHFGDPAAQVDLFDSVFQQMKKKGDILP